MIINANSVVELAIQINNGIMINANASVRSIVSVQKIIIGILVHVFVRKVRYLKSIADTSVTV